MDIPQKLDYAPGPLPASPLRELLSLSIPTIAQMASYTVMQFLDAWMLASVSPTVESPTAVGNAGLLSFAVISFGMGVLWVVNTLASQSFGRTTYAECGRYLWQGVWFAIAFAGFLSLILPILAPAFRLMGHEPSLVRLEDAYLKIVLGASVLKLVGAAFSQFLLAVNKPNVVFFATVAGVSINALAAYTLVLGHFSSARHGVVGTAWAQNIGVGVETAALIIFAFLPTVRRTFHVKDWKPRAAELKTLFRVGAPSGVQVVADVLAWSLFGMWVMGQFGTDAMAANNFMMQYMKVSFMPAFGMSVAVTALVGRYIGMGRPEVAAARAHLGFKLTAVYMLLCGAGFFFLRRQAIELFTREPEVLRIGVMLMIFSAVYQFFDAMYISYNGALRGAGDTFVPALATGVLCWSITVFGGYVVARFWPRFGVAGPWTIATIYGVILGVFMYIRFARGKWRAIHLNYPASNPTLDSAKLSDVSGPLSVAVDEALGSTNH